MRKLMFRKPVWAALGVALVAAVALGVMALTGGGDQAQAQVAQFHGITILKGCDRASKVGDTTSCFIRAQYADDYGDTIVLHEAWDEVASGTGTVRVPATGNLPIDSVSGNSTCTVGGSLPCDLGPDPGTGGPGPNAGAVTFRSDQYVVQAGDPDPLTDQGTVRWQDLCDAPGTSGCNPTPDNIIQAPAATDLLHPCLEVEKECLDDITKVSDEVDYSVTIRNCSDDTDEVIDDVVDSLAGDLADCDGVVLSPSETCTIPYSYVVQPGDDPGPGGTLMNRVDVDGHVVELGNPLHDWDECGTPVVHPCLEADKTCDPYTKVGDEVDYGVTIHNCSPDDVDVVIDDVVDSLAGDLADCDGVVLSPSETCTIPYSYVVQPGDDPGPGGTLVNVVDVDGHVVELGNPVDARAECGTELVHPAFEISKVCWPDVIPVGDDINWDVTVHNTGDVALLVDVEDPTAGISEADIPLAPGASHVISASRPVTAADAPAITNIATATATLPPELGLANVIEPDPATATCEVEERGEGCTPGFWKNNMPPWGPTGWSTFDPFEIVFGTGPDPFATSKLRVDDPTLLEVLGARGGGINALSRHAVAALLNASHPDISYGMGPAAIIAAYQAALLSGDKAVIEAQKDMFDELNNAGCPVDAHGRIMD